MNMKNKNILIAFILNLFFALFEIVGGILTGSVAIVSDALHDMGDAASIGVSLLLEKKSARQPDKKYTYGYLRFSVLGGLVTTLVLLFGSAAVIYNAINRILNPAPVNYNGMIIFAVIGAAVNFAAAYFTKDGSSVNQRAVNLHMLEDVLGWLAVLIGAVVMRFTDFRFIDPLMSIGVAVFIIIHAVKNLKAVLDVFLEKTPDGIDIDEIKNHLMNIDGVLDVHHIHIRSLDGTVNCAEMHIAADGDFHAIKEEIRSELKEHGIAHATVETESADEQCREKLCRTECSVAPHSHHHH